MTLKFSIITVVYNNADSIKDAIASVASQTYKNYEHIIIDGASNDGTLDVINQYRNGNLRIISESDKGIYDAMNKGIALASGDIIGFLNSDDIYVDEFVLQSVTDGLSDASCDSVYGDLLYVDREDTTKVVRYWKAGLYSKRRFYWGWMPPHPTFFAKKNVYSKYGGFNISMGSSADYELMLRFLLKNKISTRYISKVLVKMRMGGVSNQSFKNRFIAHRMDRMAWKINSLKPYPWTILLKPVSKIKQFLIKP